jgi:fused signal recognition particle receptor
MSELEKMTRTAQRIIPRRHMKRCWSWTQPPDKTVCNKLGFVHSIGRRHRNCSDKARRNREGWRCRGNLARTGVPVRYVGVGEKAGDLLPFDPREFVESLFA